MRTRLLRLAMILALGAPIRAHAFKVSDQVSLDGYFKGWSVMKEDPATKSFGINEWRPKSSRLILKLMPNEVTTGVIIPELVNHPYAYLLDAYVQIKQPGKERVLRMGQFKFPFGYDRMFTPAQLRRVDYSPISGAIFARDGWDTGALIIVGEAWWKLTAAMVQGVGSTLLPKAPASAAATDASTGTGTFELKWAAINLSVIGSAFYGNTGLPANKRLWVTGVALRQGLGPATLEAEVINHELGRWGLHVQPWVKLPGNLELGAFYDRIKDHTTPALDKNGAGGVLAWDATKQLRLTVQGEGQVLKSAKSKIESSSLQDLNAFVLTTQAQIKW